MPPEAREVLDRKEVTRQSILFEIVKSEKDYVADLELVQEVRLNHMVVWVSDVRQQTKMPWFSSWWALPARHAEGTRVVVRIGLVTDSVLTCT